MLNIIDINSETIYFIGDIHGNFGCIHNFIKRYGIRNSTLFFCGDCGFGFNKMSHYKEHVFPKLSKLLSKTNNYCVFIRGNHDDPDLYNSFVFNNKRIKAVPDYTIVNVFCENDKKTVLCIGGAISVDRSYRMKLMDKAINEYCFYHFCDKEEARKKIQKIYWSNESCYYDKEPLDGLRLNNINVDIVATHTCPSFCKPLTKDGISYWLTNEKCSDIDELSNRDLVKDLDNERQAMTNVYVKLKNDKHPLKYWFYGHFHWHNFENIDGVSFYLLDMEHNGNIDAIPVRVRG